MRETVKHSRSRFDSGTPALHLTMIVWPREQNPECASVMVTLDFSPCLRQIEHWPRTRVACSSACQTVRFASCGLLWAQDANSNAAAQIATIESRHAKVFVLRWMIHPHGTAPRNAKLTSRFTLNDLVQFHLGRIDSGPDDDRLFVHRRFVFHMAEI